MTGFSLRAKLTLALLFVGLSSAFLVGLVAREILLRRFDEIQLSESFGRFHDDVVAYFGKYQTWENAARSEPFGQFSRELNAARGPGRGGRGGPKPPEQAQPPFRFLLLEPKPDPVLLAPAAHQTDH